MPIPSFDDPRSFVQDFGVPIIFAAAAGTATPFTVTGIFDEKYMDVRLGSFDMATAPAPCIRCVASDVVALKKHDQATVCDPVAGTQTVYYLDHDPHPDGHGMAFVFVSLDTNEV
jgi:hypothetical protein